MDLRSVMRLQGQLIPLLPLLLACAVSPCAGMPSERPGASPVCVIGGEVKVHVSAEWSLVEGRHWVQYIEVYDPDRRAHLTLHYAVFVPRGISDLGELASLTQIKLAVGDHSFAPVSVDVAEPHAPDWIIPSPEDATVAWFQFDLPREFAQTRFEVVISCAQPHYLRKGEKVAAYLPWIPEFERLKMKRPYFEVIFDAMPGVTFEQASIDQYRIERTPTRLSVRPVHRECIAVAVHAADSNRAE